jgi:hypothetical protein
MYQSVIYCRVSKASHDNLCKVWPKNKTLRLLMIIFVRYGQKINDTVVPQNNHKFDKKVPEISSSTSQNNIHELGEIQGSNSNSSQGWEHMHK